MHHHPRPSGLSCRCRCLKKPGRSLAFETFRSSFWFCFERGNKRKTEKRRRLENKERSRKGARESWKQEILGNILHRRLLLNDPPSFSLTRFVARSCARIGDLTSPCHLGSGCRFSRAELMLFLSTTLSVSPPHTQRPPTLTNTHSLIHTLSLSVSLCLFFQHSTNTHTHTHTQSFTLLSFGFWGKFGEW